MFDKLLAISVELSQCQYGNYVMQHIVIHSHDYRALIEDIFHNNFIVLSCNKYASNVIEKVIKLSSQEYREKLATCLHHSEKYPLP
jgi:predicted nucleic-acid-binding Zn-ribbon protein